MINGRVNAHREALISLPYAALKVKNTLSRL